MPIKAHLPHKTSKNKHTIRRFIPKNLFKAFKIISRKSQYHNPESIKLLSYKPDSQNLDTSNAKTHNTKLIGHKTSFPKQQAPSVSCCEFLHLKCRDFVNQVCRTTVFWIRDFGIVIFVKWFGKLWKGFWE